MPTILDIFKDDAYGVVSLTDAINLAPYVPNTLGAMGLFQEEGVSTLTVAIEENNGQLSLIPTAARGSRPNVGAGAKRKLRDFRIPHIPLDGEVMADDVQGVRRFGSDIETEGVADVVAAKLAQFRQSHELTHEWHRLGAVKGVVVDADGTSEIHDLFDKFGLVQTTVNMDLTDDTLEVKLKAFEVIRAIRLALGGTPFTGIQALCGDDFFDALVTHPLVKAAYNRYQDGQFLRDNQLELGFEFPRGVFWENYRGTVNGTAFVDAEECHFFPVGVTGLFRMYYGPADFVETVNTIGLPVYAKQQPLPFDKGVQLHTQSNPLAICTRPKCLVKGTMTAGSGS